jgi:hypothetical protein
MNSIKTYFLCISAHLLFLTSLKAQVSAVPETLVVFGTDFSLAKIVTSNSYDLNMLIRSDIPRLNQEMVKICNQFKEKFWAKELLIDTTDVTRINAQVSATTLITNKRFIFNDGDSSVREVLKNYDVSPYRSIKGVGLLFVMEKIDEREDRESFYILMFDLQSKVIIHCDKVETGLSLIKNVIGSGWFSWKTGILKTVKAIDDVYDFWSTYPEKEKIDITEKKKKLPLNDSIHPVVIDSAAISSMKGIKLVMLDVSLALLGDDMAGAYRSQFTEKYGATNIYGVDQVASMPKINLSADYGISKKQVIGVSVGYDRCYVIWGIKPGGSDYKDTWSRYQVSLRWNYYFVRLPVFNMYAGIQGGYDFFGKTLSPCPDQFSSTVEPFPINLQLHLGMAFFIRKKTGINIRGGLGVAGDYITLGISRKL